jgi:hypothetical protein
MVKLSDVLEALESPEDWECLLDRKTGKIIAITENERPHLEDDEAQLEALPDWLRDAVREVQDALETGDLVELPSKFDVHEWDIMRRFSGEQEEPARSELLEAIHGSGAFRLFRRTTERLGLREGWFRFRDEALEAIAREWLQANDIEITEG